MTHPAETWKYEKGSRAFRLYKGSQAMPLTIPVTKEDIDPGQLLQEGVPFREVVVAMKYLGSCSWSCGPDDWHPGGKCHSKGCFTKDHHHEKEERP